MATLFQPTQEVKREGKMQIRKLLNNRSLEQAWWYLGNVMIVIVSSVKSIWRSDSQEKLPVTESLRSRCIPLHGSEPQLQLGSDRLSFRRALRALIKFSNRAFGYLATPLARLHPCRLKRPTCRPVSEKMLENDGGINVKDTLQPP
ncbi:hypothetical protein TNCV_5088421 [Trichonephila clavipes]|nr:hypothetical protein TNCV_5088421 [Trichonephila clavipes]